MCMAYVPQISIRLIGSDLDKIFSYIHDEELFTHQRRFSWVEGLPMARVTGKEATGIGMRSTLLGISTNIVLAAIKGTAGVLGHSYALIADAVESTADIATSIVVLSGLRIAAKPADEDHPYGHGKAEPLATLAVSIALCIAAVGIAVESVFGILSPSHSPEAYTLVVVGIVIIVKETLFRVVSHAGQSIGSNAVNADAWHHRSDAITSAAAFIGISIALLGGPAYAQADAWAALFASGIIAWNGVRLMRPALSEIMDAVPKENIESLVRMAARAVDGVRGLDRCTTRKMGLEYYVDLHVVVDGNETVRRGHQIAHSVKLAIQTSLPHVTDVLVHIEPLGEEDDAVSDTIVKKSGGGT